MDKFNRGKSCEHNSEIHIELLDEYEHIDNSIEYVIENVLQATNTETESFQTIRRSFNSVYDSRCLCNRLLNENQEQCTSSGCFHGGNYVMYQDNETKQYELVLNENRKSKDVIYECSDQCDCAQNCCNRLVRFGPRLHLKITDFSHLNKQLGLVTTKAVPKGAFVCEYAGEILCKDEAIIRYRYNDENNQMNYIICLNEYPMMTDDSQTSQPIQTFIDPKYIGNIGRYLNHSCDPNCEIISVRLDGIIPKLCKKLAKITRHEFN